MKREKKTKRDVPPISPWEMEIMQVLWQSDGLSIVQAQTALGRPIGYTTVQTRLNRLVEKGLVQKSTLRPSRYSAAVPPEEISAGHLDLLLEKVSGGSVLPLIAQLMQGRSFTPGELAALKELVREQEKKIPAAKGGSHV